MPLFTNKLIYTLDISRLLKLALLFLLLGFSGSMSGCRPQTLPEKEYKAYMTNPANGLLQSQMVSTHLKISAQYIPPAYLAAQEMRRLASPINVQTYDSLKTAYHSNATFYLTIESTDAKLDLRSVLHTDVTDMSQLAAALSRLDMEFPSGLSLILQDKTYVPSLCIRESAPGVNQKITFIAVFPVFFDQVTADTCTLSWKDNFFQKSGTSFLFELSDIKVTPNIQF